MGTPEFADASLKALLSSKHEVIAVVTQPDRPADGMQVCCSPIKQTAERHSIPVMQPERIADEQYVAKLRGGARRNRSSCGQKIPKAVLDIPMVASTFTARCFRSGERRLSIGRSWMDVTAPV